MNKPTDIGMNRTGIGTSPIDSPKLIDAAKNATPPKGSADEQAALRRDYSKQAPPLGTLPPPASVKGVAKTAYQLVKGVSPNVLIDQLGERLAFERAGVRLYELLMVKLEAASEAHEATRGDLEHLRGQELSHAGMLIHHIRSLGADPTVVTPSANVMAVTSQGLAQVLSDPRTTLTQAMSAMLCAELADRDMWEMLVQLAQAMGQDAMAADFRQAFHEEEDHLARVRRWTTRTLFVQSGFSPDLAAPPPP